ADDAGPRPRGAEVGGRRLAAGRTGARGGVRPPPPPAPPKAPRCAAPAPPPHRSAEASVSRRLRPASLFLVLAAVAGALLTAGSPGATLPTLYVQYNARCTFTIV